MITESKYTEVNELNQMLFEIKQFLYESKSRKMSALQKRIVLKPKLLQLKLFVNAIALSQNIDPSDRCQICFDTTAEFGNLMNLLPREGELYGIYLEISCLINVLIMNTTSFAGSQAFWQNIGSAQLISRILTDVEIFDKIPDYPSPDSPDYPESIRMVFNLLNLTGGVFRSVINILYTIPKTHFIEWSNKAFLHYDLLYKFIMDTQYPKGPIKWYQTNVSVVEQFRRIFFNYSSFPAIIFGGFNLYTTFGNLWPEDIDTKDLYLEKSLYGVLEKAEEIIKYLEDFIRFVQDDFANGNLNKNDEQDIEVWFKQIRDLKTNLSTTISLLLLKDKFLHIIDPEKLLFSIYDAEDSYNWQLKQLKETSGNKEKSPAYIFQMTDFLLHYAYYAKLSKDKAYFEKIKSEIYEIIGETPPDQYTLAKEIMAMANLYVDSYLEENVNWKKYIDMFEEIRASQEFQARSYLSNTILITILTYLDEKSYSERIDILLEEAFENGIKRSGQIHLTEDFDKYKTALREVFKTGELSDQFDEFSVTKNPFDIYTWLIPNFNKFIDSERDLSPIFLSFNLLKYQIMEN